MAKKCGMIAQRYSAEMRECGAANRDLVHMNQRMKHARRRRLARTRGTGTGTGGTHCLPHLGLDLGYGSATTINGRFPKWLLNRSYGEWPNWKHSVLSLTHVSAITNMLTARAIRSYWIPLVPQRLKIANDHEITKRLGDWLRRQLPGLVTRCGGKALSPNCSAQRSTSDRA